jgi:hypothetical protein
MILKKSIALTDQELIAQALMRGFPQEGLSKVPASSLDFRYLFKGDWSPIEFILISWQKKGLIKIVKLPSECDPKELSIVILKWIPGGQDLPENWIRDG